MCAKWRSYTRRQKIIIVIAILMYFGLSAYIIPSVAESISANNSLNQPRTVHIVLPYNYNGLYVNSPESPIDINIDLTLHLSRGTLIVGDPVKISGVAVLNGTALTEDAQAVTLSFANSQNYPVTQNNNGITKEPNLQLIRMPNSDVMTGNATITWTLERQYSISLAIANETSSGLFSFFFAGTFSSPMITVYPKAEYAQIVTNSTSVVLTVAIYILTLVGTTGIFLDVWNRKPSTQNSNNKGKNSNSNSETTDTITEIDYCIIHPK